MEFACQDLPYTISGDYMVVVHLSGSDACDNWCNRFSAESLRPRDSLAITGIVPRDK